MIDVAVVLISKNQAWNIARLIESVLREVSCASSHEIVLVDSASTDETIEIANRYPISIVRLHPDQRLTAAAGRYVGYQHTTGDCVLFLDGDMELYPGWLEQGLNVLHDRPDVAVVTGEIIDLPRNAHAHDKPSLQQPAMGLAGPTEIPYCAGAGMYRRSVLEQVGTFNPSIYSDEEPELCVRIRHAEYQVLEIGHPIAYHYSDPGEALLTLVRRWRRNLYLGSGQNIRYHLGSKLLWPYIKERGFGCVPILALTLSFFSFLYSFKTHRGIWFKLWILLLIGVIAGDAYRKRSLYRAIYTLVQRIFILDGTIRGFLMTPLAPDDYLRKIDVIKKISQ